MVKALVFDAYGTLFDVRSVLSRCEEVFPGHGADLTGLWRTKQLEYTWLRALMGRYEDFWQVTQDGLVFACRSLGLAPLTASDRPPDAGVFDAESLPGDPRRPGGPGRCSLLDSLQRHAEDARQRGPKRRVWRAGSSMSSAWTRFAPTSRSPAVYQLAETRLGIRREEIGFVSSNGWDVAGGKAFGFQAYWLNRQNAPTEMLGVQPDRIIHSAMELTSVLA